MKIDTKGIENMLVTSTINDYGVKGKKNTHVATCKSPSSMIAESVKGPTVFGYLGVQRDLTPT